MPNINLTLPYIFSVRVHSHFMLSSSHVNLDWAGVFFSTGSFILNLTPFFHISLSVSLCVIFKMLTCFSRNNCILSQATHFVLNAKDLFVYNHVVV